MPSPALSWASPPSSSPRGSTRQLVQLRAMGFELDAIAAVIIGRHTLTGGRGTVWGTIIGAIILGMINNMLNMLGVSPYLQGTVKGLVIIAAVYIQRGSDRGART